mgnify:CR=1 FL=1
MNNLTLHRMEKLGIYKWLNEKERDKSIEKALEEQQSLLNTPPKKKGELTLDEVLRDGGATVYSHNDNKYHISVLTPDQVQVYDNLNSYMEQGYEVSLPPLYKFHIRTSLGNLFTVKCATYQIAQEIVDEAFGNGRYKVSASKL